MDRQGCPSLLLAMTDVSKCSWCLYASVGETMKNLLETRINKKANDRLQPMFYLLVPQFSLAADIIHGDDLIWSFVDVVRHLE